jgi:hypothetical protein
LTLSPEAAAFVHRHIKKHKEKYHMKQSQAIAVALDEARSKGYNIPAGTKKMESLK